LNTTCCSSSPNNAVNPKEDTQGSQPNDDSVENSVDEVIGNLIDDANVAYTLHYYAATHKKELRDLAQQAIDAGIPIFVSEYGVSEASGEGSIDVMEANTWRGFLDANNIS
jgi:endoglucanase